MPVQFAAAPAALAALALALVGLTTWSVWLVRRSLTDLSPARKRISLGLRLLLLLLLFLSLAGMRWVLRSDNLCVVFVLDASRSVRDDQRQDATRFIQEAARAKRKTDTVALVSVGDEAELHTPPSDKLPTSLPRHAGHTAATDLAQGLETALAVVPRGTAGKVVVLSDFNENVGSALASVPGLTARGVRVDAHLLRSSVKREALIEKVVVPGSAKIGEPFTVKVALNALNAQKGRLTLLRDGKIEGHPLDIDIAPGRQVHEFQTGIDKPGFYSFQAMLETDSSRDTLSDNNRGQGFVQVRGKPRILYVSAQAGRGKYLAKALGAQSIVVEQRGPEGIPATPVEFQQYDSVVLSDVPSDAFGPSQLTALQTAVRDFGVGFCMVGGENSFGLGGYRRTVVEDMLPVSLEIRKMQRFPPVTVALVIDRSGSMGEGPGSKLTLALEAAIRAVQALKPGDKVCVVTFTFGADLHVPLCDVAKAPEIIQAITRIGGGGGTSVYSGAAMAFDNIKDDNSPIKHILLLTDGQSNDPDWRPLVAQMRDKKITMTTVGVSSGQGDINAPLLAWLADQTKGRFYSVQKPADIPRIYLQEIERISSKPIVEEPFVPRPLPPAEDVLRGMGASFPPLLGYNVTTPKPAADLMMISHKSDPVLAGWHYGLGRTVAFTSDDKNRWAVHWLPWGDFGRFWAQTVRWSMRSFAPADFQTQITMDRSQGHVVVDAIDQAGKFVNRLNFRAKVAGPDATSLKGAIDVPLRQTGPGRYEAWFDAARLGTYLVNVIRERPDKTVESTVTGLVVPYSPEYRDLGPNEYLMTQMTRAGSGSTLADPSAVFRANRPTVSTPIDLAPWMLLAALLLFPVDVGVRRLALRREDAVRAWAWIAARLPRRHVRTDAAATPELARLHGAKHRAKSRGKEATLVPEGDELAEATPARPTPPAPTAEPAKAPAAAPTVVWNVDRRPADVSDPPSQTEPTPRTAEPPAKPAEGPTLSRLMEAKRRAAKGQNPEGEE